MIGAAVIGAAIYGYVQTQREQANRQGQPPGVMEDSALKSVVPGSYSQVRSQNRAQAKAQAKTNDLDSHHVVLDAEVSGALRGYSKAQAPAISMTKEQHHQATAAQRAFGKVDNPTLGFAIDRGYAGLKAANVPDLEIDAKMREVQGYFYDRLGYTPETPVNSLRW